MRKKLAVGATVTAVAALLVTNPMVADAARMITSADIVNGTIQSRDIDNKTIKAKDIAPKAVKSWNIADGQVFSKDIANGTLKREDFDAGVLPVAAYARITAGANGATLDGERSSGVTAVTRTAVGTYCLELAPGVDRNVAVIAAPEGGTQNAGTDSALWSGSCGTNGVQVMTEQLSNNQAGNLVSNPVNDVSFMVLVP